ncbi:hypothetical protein BH09ACT5_BH09ACT5_24860 [soil metagenome]
MSTRNDTKARATDSPFYLVAAGAIIALTVLGVVVATV